MVLSLFWVVATILAGLSWGAVIGVPIGFGILLYVVVWAIRGFGVKEQCEIWPRRLPITWDKYFWYSLPHSVVSLAK